MDLENIRNESSLIEFQFEYASQFSCKQSLGWRGTDITDAHEKSTKNQVVTEWYRYSKSGVMDKNRVFSLPWSWNCGILWIIGYEIWWYECSHSESLKLSVYFQ